MAGRPSTFTPEVVEAICEKLSDGQSLRDICLADGMPTRSTVFKWLSENEAFSDQYARAREAGMEAMSDEILEIADESGFDYTKDDDGNVKVNGDAINRAKLRVDSRKWLMSKIAPKKYGDKIALDHSGSIETMSEDKVNARLAELFGKAGVSPTDGTQKTN